MRTTIHGNRWLTQGSRKNSAGMAVRLSAGSNTSILTARARTSALKPSLPPLGDAVTMCRPGTNLLEKGKEDDTVSESPPSTTTSTSLPAGTVVALNTTACSMQHVRADSGSKSTRTVLLCSGEDSLFLYTVFSSFLLLRAPIWRHGTASSSRLGFPSGFVTILTMTSKNADVKH